MKSSIICGLHQILLGGSNNAKLDGQACSIHIGDIRNSYKILVGNPEGMRTYERPKFRWEYTIKMEFKKIGWEVMNLVLLPQYREQCWTFEHGNKTRVP
jgi:hypothetical protein